VDGGRLILEIVEGPSAGRQIPLDGSIEVGRDQSAGLHLDDEQISRRHAVLAPEGDHATVEDLGSSNGTYVNDQPAQGKRELRRGDQVRFGLTVLQVRSQEEVRRSPSAVGPVPDFTVVPDSVLRPAQPEELSPVDADVDVLPNLLVDESEPAFVPRTAADDSPASPYGRVGKLVDTRVKHRTNVAAIALLSISSLVVLIFFGAK
jgi:pSer/pThr/pTyr-binding forkhead associated (FHA) protein